MAHADDFAARFYGQPVEREDPSNADQCMDWAFAWVDELGIPREAIRHLYAYQVFTEPNDVTRQYFEIVGNTPDGVPRPGALVVSGTSVGVAGHIELALSGCTSDTLISAAQNWNYKLYVQKVSRGYFGVIGWLVPKQVQQSNQGNEEMPSFWEIPLDQATSEAWYKGYLGRDPQPGDPLPVVPGPFLQAATQELLKRAAGESSAGAEKAAVLVKQVSDLTVQLQAQQAVIEAQHKLTQVPPAATAPAAPAQPTVSWMATTQGKAALRIAGVVLGVVAAHVPAVQSIVSDPNVANVLGASIGITLGSVVSDVKNPSIPNSTKGGD